MAASAVSAQSLKRTTFKTDRLDFGMGGTVSLVGAPRGSVTIEGWQRNEVEISAEVENEARTAAALDAMAVINGFVLDEGLGHIRINAVGTDDKALMKRLKHKVPKEAGAYRISFTIRVPRFTDLDINGGEGAFSLRDVDGTIKVNFAKSDSRIALAGGIFFGTFGEGDVRVSVPTRSWRGRLADVQLAKGRLSLVLPRVFDAEVSADVLRTGKVENMYEPLKPRPRTAFTEKSVVGKAGNGGVSLKMTVGDGLITISESEP